MPVDGVPVNISGFLINIPASQEWPLIQRVSVPADVNGFRIASWSVQIVVPGLAFGTEVTVKLCPGQDIFDFLTTPAASAFEERFIPAVGYWPHAVYWVIEAGKPWELRLLNSPENRLFLGAVKGWYF